MLCVLIGLDIPINYPLNRYDLSIFITLVGNREKSLAFYSDRVEKEKAARPALSELYASVLGSVAEGRRPRLASLMAG